MIIPPSYEQLLHSLALSLCCALIWQYEKTKNFNMKQQLPLSYSLFVHIKCSQLILFPLYFLQKQLFLCSRENPEKFYLVAKNQQALSDTTPPKNNAAFSHPPPPSHSVWRSNLNCEGDISAGGGNCKGRQLDVCIWDWMRILNLWSFLGWNSLTEMLFARSSLY